MTVQRRRPLASLRVLSADEGRQVDGCEPAGLPHQARPRGARGPRGAHGVWQPGEGAGECVWQRSELHHAAAKRVVVHRPFQ